MLRLIRPFSSKVPTPTSLQGANARLQHFLKRADSIFLKSVSRFHEVTGYDAIEKIKAELAGLEGKLSSQRELVKIARDKYNVELTNRSDAQREMNELLLRKSTWTPVDLERFTLLYKHDHSSQRAVELSKTDYDHAEGTLEDMQLRAGSLMGARYREEQLFSDRIRQASTWGTWVLMGINILLFILVTLVVEPYKRRKLVRAFEEKVKDLLPQSPVGEFNAGTEEIVPNAINNATENTNSAELEPKSSTFDWNNLWERLLQPLVVLRPVEVGALALASYLVTLSSTLLVVLLTVSRTR